MQTRAIIIVSGDVQGVGYRDTVSKIARKLKLAGFVENTKPYDVKIVCEGSREHIDSFIKQLKIKQYPINVENINIEFIEPTGEFEYFEIRRGDIAEELGERLDIARFELNRVNDKLDINTSILRENTSILKDFKNETDQNFGDLKDICDYSA